MSELSDRSVRAVEGSLSGGVAFAKTSAWLAQILSQQGIGLCLVRSNFRIAWANRRHVELHSWGSRGGETCYRQLAGLGGPCAGCLVKEVLRTGRPARLERRLPADDGEKRVCLAASPVFGHARRLEYVMLTTVDLGDVEHSLGGDEAEKMASLGVMAAGVVHELNNIIGGMSGHAELAMLYPEKAEMSRHALEVVTQSSRRAGPILKQLTDYSRQSTTVVASFDFIEVVEQVLHVVSRNLELAGVRVNRRFDSSSTVTANPWRVRTLLLNVMLDVTAGGVKRDTELTVEVGGCHGSPGCRRRHAGCEENGCVRLCMSYRLAPSSAQACGEAPLCLFECARADDVHRRRPLDAVSRAAAGMGGVVEVSEDESLRRIEIMIPLDATASHGRGGTGLPRRVKPGRVLVVDDEESIRELVSVVLGDEGYDVTTATSGRSAVELVRVKAFDVVVLDVMMPGELDGLSAFHEIRRIRPECRILLMTGRPPDDELEEQLRQADAHVLKPFHCRQLLDRLRDIAV